MIGRLSIALALTLLASGCYMSVCADPICRESPDSQADAASVIADSAPPDAGTDTAIDASTEPDAAFDGGPRPDDCVVEPNGMPTMGYAFASTLITGHDTPFIGGTCGNTFLVASSDEHDATIGELRRIRVIASTNISTGSWINNETSWPIAGTYGFIQGTYGYLIAGHPAAGTHNVMTRAWSGEALSQTDLGPQLVTELFGSSLGDPRRGIMAGVTANATETTVRMQNINSTGAATDNETLAHVPILGSVRQFGPMATSDAGTALTLAFREGQRAKIAVILFNGTNAPQVNVIHDLALPTTGDTTAFIINLAKTIRIRPMRDRQSYLLVWQASNQGYARRLTANGSMPVGYVPVGKVMDADELSFGIATISVTEPDATYIRGSLVATVFDKETGAVIASTVAPLIGPPMEQARLAHTVGGQVIGSVTTILFHGSRTVQADFFIFHVR